MSEIANQQFAANVDIYINECFDFNINKACVPFSIMIILLNFIDIRMKRLLEIHTYICYNILKCNC